MKTSLTNQFSKFYVLLCSLLLVFLFSSCEKDNISGLEDNILDAKAKKIGKANNASGFQAFHQGFNHNTDAWADQYVEGVLGWCGTISLQNRASGLVNPSAGKGYATVSWGECNTFWSEEADEMGLPLFEYGAPATQDPALWSSTWPESGFVQQLDIYLDPAMFEEGLAFIYSSSLKAQESMSFAYFAINVMKSADALVVDDFAVTEAGWYGFKYVFQEGGEGDLQIEFQLLDQGKVIFSTSLNEDLGGAPVTDYAVNDYGSGYVWFVSIAEGVALPIDEYKVRPGK